MGIERTTDGGTGGAELTENLFSEPSVNSRKLSITASNWRISDDGSG
jgi:hypothetical protein